MLKTVPCVLQTLENPFFRKMQQPRKEEERGKKRALALSFGQTDVFVLLEGAVVEGKLSFGTIINDNAALNTGTS